MIAETEKWEFGRRRLKAGGDRQQTGDNYHTNLPLILPPLPSRNFSYLLLKATHTVHLHHRLIYPAMSSYQEDFKSRHEQDVEDVLGVKLVWKPQSRRNRSTIPFSPTQCVVSEHQGAMHSAFATGGVPMLAHYLYKYGQDRFNAGKPDNMWRYFPKDEDSLKPVLPFLLKSIHPQIIPHLIHGDLPYQYNAKQSIRTIIDRDFTLTTTPGIYINFFCREDTDTSAPSQAGSPPPDPHARKGFTINQLKAIARGMKRYLRANVTANDYAEKVDHPCCNTH